MIIIIRFSFFGNVNDKIEPNETVPLIYRYNI